MTDDRFLDATEDDMALDAWADYYERLREGGGGAVIEDDEFDAQAILDEAARRYRAEHEDEPIDDWAPDDQ